MQLRNDPEMDAYLKNLIGDDSDIMELVRTAEARAREKREERLVRRNLVAFALVCFIVTGFFWKIQTSWKSATVPGVAKVALLLAPAPAIYAVYEKIRETPTSACYGHCTDQPYSRPPAWPGDPGPANPGPPWPGHEEAQRQAHQSKK